MIQKKRSFHALKLIMQVAKKDPDMFVVLVDRAKYFVVEKSLELVFVSSEGHWDASYPTRHKLGPGKLSKF